MTKAAAEAKQQEQLVEIERLERDKTLEHDLARVTADYFNTQVTLKRTLRTYENLHGPRKVLGRMSGGSLPMRTYWRADSLAEEEALCLPFFFISLRA